MIGLYFLTVVGIYVFAWYWIVRWCKPRWAKWVLILVAVAIPTWDLVPQHIAYREACRSEAGDHVASESIAVRGFFDPDMSEIFAHRFVENQRIEYVETYTSLATGKKLVRVERGANGDARVLEISGPTSQYEVSDFSFLRTDLLRASGRKVTDRATGKVVASHTRIAKARSWVFRALFPPMWPGGGGAACSGGSPREPLNKYPHPRSCVLPRSNAKWPAASHRVGDHHGAESRAGQAAGVARPSTPGLARGRCCRHASSSRGCGQARIGTWRRERNRWATAGTNPRRPGSR